MCMSKDRQGKYQFSILTAEQLYRLVEDFVSTSEFNNLKKVEYPIVIYTI